MLSERDADGFVDVADNLTDDIAEPADTSDQVDKMLDTMSLDELHKLREDLTNGNIADISDLRPIDEPDFAFHWDGGPTHNTDLDEDTEPSPHTKKLTR